MLAGTGQGKGDEECEGLKDGFLASLGMTRLVERSELR